MPKRRVDGHENHLAHGRPGLPIGETGGVGYKDEEDARKSVEGVHVAEPMMEPMMARVG